MNTDTNIEQMEQTRFNMVEQQIRPWGVLDLGILELLYKIKREQFTPPAYRSLAFVDMEIPLDDGGIMLAPKLEARILQELQLKETDKVLEIGTGSGYQTALLAEKAAHVYSVEISPILKTMAENNLKAVDSSNITIEQGDAAQGWSKNGPFDVIVLTASLPVLPDTFQHTLNPGGRMFVVVGEEPIMEAVLITCQAHGKYETKKLFETCIQPLKNAKQPKRFAFDV